MLYVFTRYLEKGLLWFSDPCDQMTLKKELLKSNLRIKNNPSYLHRLTLKFQDLSVSVKLLC